MHTQEESLMSNIKESNKNSKSPEESAIEVYKKGNLNEESVVYVPRKPS